MSGGTVFVKPAVPAADTGTAPFPVVPLHAALSEARRGPRTPDTPPPDRARRLAWAR